MSALTDEQREAELMKKKGNEQFVEKNLNLALDFYQKAVELGESLRLKVSYHIGYIIKSMIYDIGWRDSMFWHFGFKTYR